MAIIQSSAKVDEPPSLAELFRKPKSALRNHRYKSESLNQIGIKIAHLKSMPFG